MAKLEFSCLLYLLILCLFGSVTIIILLVDWKPANISPHFELNNFQGSDCLMANPMGGLGNILFIVFSTFGIAQDTLRSLKINLDKITRTHHSNVNYFEPTNGFLRYFASPAYKIQKTPDIILYEDNKFKKKDWCQELRTDKYKGKKVLLHGQFQSDVWFKQHRETLFKILYWGSEDKLNRLKQKYPNLDTAFFIHVRLGDYLHPLYKAIHYIDLSSYYTRCLDLAIKKFDNPTIYLFTNDVIHCMTLPWVQDLKTKIAGKFVAIQENEINSLYLMKECKLGGISGNSTFGWFGLYLDTSRPLLCLPNVWFNPTSGIDASGLYFDECTKVSIMATTKSTGIN